MTTNPSSFNMRFFMDTPLPFDGDMFNLWKGRFKTFIKTNDFEI